MSFPDGLSSIDFAPFLPMDGDRSDGGDVWWTMDADAYWRGRASTSKLNSRLLQDWEGFMLEAMLNQSVIEFVDPVFRIPAEYRASGLPAGFDGTGIIMDLDDPLNPVIFGLPVGLKLKRGDRIGVVSAGNKACHLITSDLTVTDDEAQAVPVLPPIASNVFSEADTVTLLNPVIRLTIVPNSWSAPRQARSEPVGTFEVAEASLVLDE